MLPDNEEFLARFAEQYQKLLAEVCARAPEIDLVEKNARLRANYPAPYAPNPSAHPRRTGPAGAGRRARRRARGRALTRRSCWPRPSWAALTKTRQTASPPCWTGETTPLVTERAIAAAVPEEFVTALVSKTLGELPIL